MAFKEREKGECRLFSLALVLAVVFHVDPAVAGWGGDDTVQLNLTYVERNGLNAPFGEGDLAMGGAQAVLAGAGMMQSFNMSLSDILNGKAQVPKTTGETMKQYMTNATSQKAASLPRNTEYHGTLNATLKWDEAKQAYLVQSGTYKWSASNNSTWQEGDHDQYSRLSASGTHQLKPNEVKLKFDGGDLSKTLGAKGQGGEGRTYDLHLNIKPKSAAVTGDSGWIVGKGGVYDTRERYTAAGVLVLSVDEYKPTKGGNDLAATSHRAEEHRPPVLFDPKLDYKADGREVQARRAKFSETWQNPIGGQASISWTVSLPGDIVADPGGPYTVERAGKVTVDGSNSQGHIKKYIWTFKLIREEPAPNISRRRTGFSLLALLLNPRSAEAAAPASGSDAGVCTKEGEKVEVKAVDTIEATLTVKGSQGSDTATTKICVVPRRDFKTAYNPADDDRKGELPRKGAQDANASVHGLTILPISGGGMAFNLCGGGDEFSTIQQWKNVAHVLHFAGGHAKEDDWWEGRAYVLKQMEDKDGPCDGVWYVEKPLFSIRRRYYLSPYFPADGLVPPHDSKADAEPLVNWHYENLEWGETHKSKPADFDPGQCVEEALNHESEHSKLIQTQLGQENGDPGMVIEKLYGKDKEELKKKVFLALKEADASLYNLGLKLDYRPEMYKGFLRLWNLAAQKWHVPVK